MQPAEIKYDRPIFYLVKRGSMTGTLDMGLKEQALSAGVEILFYHRFSKSEGKAIIGTGAKGELVTGGPYAYIRHPQYSGLFIVMTGMLIQWPTIITAFMFPVLIFVYYRLSKREESEIIELFGEDYKRYMLKTPMFIPGFGGKA